MDSIIPADCWVGSAIPTSFMPTITQRTSAIVSASCAGACTDDSVRAPTSTVNKVFRIEVLLDLGPHPETTHVKCTGNACMLSNCNSTTKCYSARPGWTRDTGLQLPPAYVQCTCALETVGTVAGTGGTPRSGKYW